MVSNVVFFFVRPQCEFRIVYVRTNCKLRTRSFGAVSDWINQ